MNHSKRFPEGSDRQGLEVWYCAHCSSVHFDFGNVTVNFSRSEFDQLMRVGLEIYVNEYGEDPFRELMETMKTQDEGDSVLLSDIVI